MYIPLSGGGGGGPAPSGTANLWVDTNGGTCTRQASPAAYLDSAACSSIQTSVAACNGSTGDTIRMVAGSYGSQSVTSQKTSPGCTVIGEQSAGTNAVTLTGALALQGAWVTVRNMDTRGLGASDAGTGLPHDVTYENINTSLSQLFWDGGVNITWRGGSFSNYFSGFEGEMVMQGIPASCPSGGGAGCNNPLQNVVIDGISFHDLGRDAACIAAGNINCHNEIIRLEDGVDGITIKNSTFGPNLNPNSGIIFVGDKNFSAPPQNLTFEGNFFGSPGGATNGFNTSASTNMPCTGFRFFYNTFAQSGPVLDNCGLPGGSAGDVEFRGNIGTKPSGCSVRATSVVWDKNVWTTAACGGTDVGNATLAFTGDGFHIGGTSAARGAGSTTYCPATDIDGEARPQPAATTCDAGADEVN